MLGREIILATQISFYADKVLTTGVNVNYYIHTLRISAGLFALIPQVMPLYFTHAHNS